MNKNAIKKFAISARTRLIATVSDKAGTLGITKEGISEPSSKGNGFEVYKTSAGTEVMLQGSQMEQRRRLVAQVNARGFDVVMEEVAYTWFNRICAIRFMEVNDYLPSRIRVLSSLKEGKNEPDLLTEAPNVELDLTEKDREWIINAKTENRLDELFSMLFIKQCNKLSEILPELFEATQDYTEMLLNLSYTNKDDVIRMLVDGVDEKDFNVTTPDENGKPTGQVEIIGWLYQYYNTELKDDTFAQLKKNVKISKERIPAATQLFTPDWIVRYMVENSVGRIWIEHLRAINPETDEKTTAEGFGWKYYLPEAEQEPEVNTKLAEIRKSYAEIKPEDILCIDPCMGSGHIIVAMFDVLMDIYKSVGYGEREAAFEIVEHNLHGLDIDKRAYQLAYFAVMMKGRQYNRRFFRGKEEGQRPQPQVYAFVESNDVNRTQLKYFGASLNELEKNNAITQMNGLLDTFKDAREYGSILNVDKYDWDLLHRFTAETNDEGQMTLDAVGLHQTQKTMLKIIDIGETLARGYDAVITNPPYMGAGGMSGKLTEYVKKCFADSKSDLFAVFIEKCKEMTKLNGCYAMITQHAWMFLSSFEKLRNKLIHENLLSMAHLGARAFDEISGEVVQTTTFTYRKCFVSNYESTFSRLLKYNGEKAKENAFITKANLYVNNIEKFEDIPNKVFAYWISDRFISIFEKEQIKDYGNSCIGMRTGDNARFLRLWFEIDKTKMGIGSESAKAAQEMGYKWIPYCKGGTFRKWYGNNEYVVNWENDGYEIKENTRRVYPQLGDDLGWKISNESYYFHRGITWSGVGASVFGVRCYPTGMIFDSGANSFFVFDESNYYYFAALLNASFMNEVIQIINPTINTGSGVIAVLPAIMSTENKAQIDELVKENIAISKEDWDMKETSWDFKKNPIVMRETVSEGLTAWIADCGDRFSRLKRNEETLNQLFINIYGLQTELDASVSDDLITIQKVDTEDGIKSLISYAVGCMFGRYSLDEDGIVYAGGTWDEKEYTTFIPDKDNIIPITDEEYFEDDIVGLFCGWLKKVYGANTLEENLDFIAEILGNKGNTSREVIRNYFLNDFFKDHCNTYSVTGSGKRPIYWLFDSGKQNGFKALIYIHRYDQNTVGRVRTDYLHKTQKAIEQAMQSAQYTLDNSKSGAEKSKATKRLSKYTKQLAEIQLYDEAIAHIANKRIALDLDDGVKVNYEKFQDVEVSREGMKTVKIDLLAKI